jgi:transcriptional regulator with XRE-family HTH domain
MRPTDRGTIPLGARLRELRKRAGLSQQQLAGRIGVAGVTVSKWERGLTYPSAQDVPAIARALGVSVGALYRESAPDGPTLEASVRELTRALRTVLQVGGTVTVRIAHAIDGVDGATTRDAARETH